MTHRFSRRAIACALLATSALTLPTALRAETPAPRFIDTVDSNGVDLATGLPSLSIEEGGIGLGPGRVSMQRIWSEGAGFLDNWSGGLYAVTANSVTKMYVQFGGISDTFSGSGTSWTSDKADGATLTVDAYGNWSYTGRDGTVILFDAPHQKSFNCPGANPGSCQVPLTITKPSGLKFTLYWDFDYACKDLPGEPCAIEHDFERLHSVISSAGYSLTIAYAGTGVSFNMTSTDPWYQRTAVTFGNSASPPSPAPTITYTNPNSTTVTVTDPANRTWTFTTDTSSRLTGVQRPGSSGNNISFAYGADGTVSSATKDGVTNSYVRSLSGTIATETQTNPLSQQRVVTADTNLGRPTSDRDGLNRTTSYAYDANARLTQITAPEGNYVQYGYDARGNVQTTTNIAKAGSGLANIVTNASYDPSCTNIVKCNQPNSTTDAKGNVTNYTYDPTHGGVLTITQPAPTTGAVQPQTRYSYTRVTGATGDLVYMLTGVSACQTASSCTGGSDETKTTAAYNSNLLPTSVTRGDGTGALAATTAITYDSHGNVSTVDGPLAGTADTTKYRYDAADQLVGVTSPDPDGAGTLKNRAIRLTYRSDGQVSKQELGTVNSQSDTDWTAFAPLQTVDIAFDGNSRPITSQLSAGGTAYSLTQTDYDSIGRVNCAAVRMNTAAYGSLPSSACTLGSQGSYGPDRINQTVYDAAGQVIQNKVAVGTTDAATETTLTYTNNGKLQTLTDGENNRTTYVYDGFDRLSQTQYPSVPKGSGTSNASDSEQLSYDAASNVTSRRLRDGQTIYYGYDALNRLNSKDLPGTEWDEGFGYDNLGRLTSTVKCSGPGVCPIQETFTSDALGRQVSEAEPYGAVTRQFDLAGNLTRTTWWDGFYVTYDHLVTGEVSAIRENGATSGVGVLASYAYDNLGNRTSVTFGNGASQVYTYDPVARLASLANNLAGTANNLSATFSYSPASQIASTARTGDAYAFGGAYNVNRGYTSNGLNQYSAAGPASFTYDARGNLTSDGTNSYTYSSENLLKSAPGATLYYDQLHRLVEYDTSVSTRFVYDGANMAAEVNNPAGAIQKRYVFGPSGEPLVEYSDSGTINRQFVSTDERGSVISLSDSSGNLIGISSYDEYGIPASTNQGRFGYTGQAWLSEIGLQYSRARIYSPTLGRFLQTDPIGYDDGPNWYAYTHGDPVNGVDPLGLDLDCDGHGATVCGHRQQDAPPITPANGWENHDNSSKTNERNDGGDRNNKNNTCGRPSLLPHGIGVTGGVSADAGIPGVAGAAASGAAGGGVFYSGKTGVSVGGFASGGAAAYAGSASVSAVRGSRPAVAGASASGGASVFITNAQSAQQLSGPFTTYSLNVGFGPIQGTISLSLSGHTYQLNVSPPFAGATVGISASKLRTTTIATPGCH